MMIRFPATRGYFFGFSYTTDIFEYIEGYYNSMRTHGILEILTLDEAEALYWEHIP